ncbi:hypothetical protein SDC9_80764 [bioreactor metagenome]|uniref:Uncharacterized protein n=1 Tax=bioreactor metagenome TaxID=1076179 RepID=A0A644Z0C3_9ZZZZ
MDIGGGNAGILIDFLHRRAALLHTLVFPVDVIGADSRNLQHFLKQVVVVQHRGLCDLIEPVGAHGANPAIGFEHHGGHAVKRADLVQPVLLVFKGIVKEVFPVVAVHQRRGQKFLQSGAHAGGAAGGAAAAVGRGKGLVQVEVTHVKPGLFGPNHAQNGVAVGLVVAAKRAHLVGILHKLRNVAVVKAGILRIGLNKAGGLMCAGGLKRLQIGNTRLGVGLEIYDFITPQRGGRRVGGVRVDGGDKFVPLRLSPADHIGLDDGGHGEQPLRAAAGLEGKPAHAGNLPQVSLRRVENLQNTLNRLHILKRM